MSALPIVRPQHPPLEDFDADFAAALESGIVTNNGPWVEKFEAALTAYLGAPTIVFCNGQSALMTMLAAHGVRGGEVITPSFTFCATPHAIEWVGARPVFADIDPWNLCLDTNSVKWRVGSRTKAILVVDPYGIAHNNWAALAELGYPVLFDSAPAFGFGLRGNAQIFSFHATKAFSTMEGGALTTTDPEIMDIAKRIRNFGQDENGDCDFPGINGKMMEVCAMIGLRQLDAWKRTAIARRVAADALEDNLRGIPGLKVVQAPHGQRPIWLYRPILIDEKVFGMGRDAVVDALKKFDIHARKYYTACHKLKCYDNYRQSLPVTERIASQVISLPVYSDMKPVEVDRIGSALRNLQPGGGY